MTGSVLVVGAGNCVAWARQKEGKAGEACTQYGRCLHGFNDGKCTGEVKVHVLEVLPHGQYPQIARIRAEQAMTAQINRSESIGGTPTWIRETRVLPPETAVGCAGWDLVFMRKWLISHISRGEKCLGCAALCRFVPLPGKTAGAGVSRALASAATGQRAAGYA
jgi:hypothetical protein